MKTTMKRMVLSGAVALLFVSAGTSQTLDYLPVGSTIVVKKETVVEPYVDSTMLYEAETIERTPGTLEPYKVRNFIKMKVEAHDNFRRINPESRFNITKVERLGDESIMRNFRIYVDNPKIKYIEIGSRNEYEGAPDITKNDLESARFGSVFKIETPPIEEF
jgi:hypothetical protein